MFPVPEIETDACIVTQTEAEIDVQMKNGRDCALPQAQTHLTHGGRHSTMMLSRAARLSP